MQMSKTKMLSITLLKASAADLKRNKAYAKDAEGAINFPYLNYHKEMVLDSFKDLFALYKKLLKLPSTTQILGKKVSDETDDTAVYRRLSKQFSFYAEDSARQFQYNYLILDIDKETPFTSKAFAEAVEYDEYTEAIILDEARTIVEETLKTKNPEMIVRLSSSFGKDSYFRGHIILPLTEPITPQQAQMYLSHYPYVDISIYRNPTQPVFSAAPLNDHLDLPRLYYREGNTTDSSQITNIRERLKNHTHNPLPATQLDGTIGVFNRHARSQQKYSIHRWLIEHKYTTEDNQRYLSPDSTTNLPGVVLFPGDYLVDFHDNSPIQTLLRDLQINKQVLTAFDLYYMSARATGKTKAFDQICQQLCNNDQVYQTYWEKRLKDSLNFISDALTIPELDVIITALVEDIFYAKLSTTRREGLFNLIVKYSPNIEGFPITKSKLKSIYAQFRKKLQMDQMEIHPENMDMLNAHALLSMVKLYKEPTHYISESLDGTHMEIILPGEPLRQRISSFIQRLSIEPRLWNIAKWEATIKATISLLDNQQDETSPTPQRSIYSFKDEPKGVDIKQNKIVDITLDQVVLQSLPFNEEDYINAKGPNWERFLATTFADAPERRETIRDLFTYILLPQRKRHMVAALIGKPRSGKSTIKNLMTELLGPNMYVETTLGSLAENFGLANLTSETRILAVNEFNAGTNTGPKNTLNAAVNTLKIISGKDEVVVRAMRENPRPIKTDALPILLSNQIPYIKDRAFRDRLITVSFNKTFSHLQDDGTFYRALKKELPYIFKWAITNPRYKNGALKMSRTETLQMDKKMVNESADILGSFFEEYLREKKGAFVSKRDLAFFYRNFFVMKKGYEPTDQDLSPQRFGINRLQNLFPSIKTHRATKKEANPRIKPRDWGFINLTWKDEEAMIKELSEFADFTEI